jgi:hypothetical protein
VGNLYRVDRRSRRDPLNTRCRSRFTAAGLVAAFLFSSADAQPELPAPLSAFGPPEGIFLAPVYEGGIRKNRGIHVPFNLRRGPERRLNFGYTASNSFLNPGFLVCADASCQLEYQSDHTGNLVFVSATQPLLDRFELGFTTGSYQINNIVGWSPVHWLANDSPLRSFHEDVLSESSLPVLSNAPSGRQVFTMTDLAGRRLTLKPEHHYALPLRVDLTRYVDLRAAGNVRMSLNAGAHLSYPLQSDLGSGEGDTAFSRGMDFGLSVNFVRSRRITASVTSTFHVQLARFRSDVHVINPNSPLSGDDTLRSQYALTYGLRFNGTFDGRAACSFAMSQVSNSAHFDKQRYWSWDPLVFEGGNNLRGALLSANDYGMLSFGCEYRGRQLQVSLFEDFAGFSAGFDDDGAGTSYDPDFAVGVTVSWILGSRRNGES